MDGITELAKLFKERENINFAGIQMAKIVSPFPNIKILVGEKILLDKDDLVVSETTYHKTLKLGDNVVLIPSNDEQTYFVIDKVVKL